jgi:hypothetical protein
MDGRVSLPALLRIGWGGTLDGQMKLCAKLSARAARLLSVHADAPTFWASLRDSRDMR